MFDKLTRADFHRVRPLFTSPLLSLAIDAVLRGNTPARIWADLPARPGTVLMWDTRHGYYLVGDPANTRFNAAARSWVSEQAQPGPFYAKVHYHPAAWEIVVPQIFAGVPLISAPRVILALEALKIADWAAQVPAGFRIIPIDEALLANPHVSNLHLVTEEISSCWRSPADFVAEGFGFCLVRTRGAGESEEILCWCTAECVSEKKLGIGIETLPAYRGRGFATLTAAAFVQQCQGRGLTPYWDAFQSNAASLAVAAKVGFAPAAGYAVFLASG